MSKPHNSSKEGAKAYKKSNSRRGIIYAIIFAALVAISVAGYLGYRAYDQVKKENQRLSNPEESARQETQRVKDQVSKLIDVPQDEDPTIASVVDASKLSNQAFFKNAQNGDKVLMYAEAKKAILYRPSTNKIIEVAPINIGDNQGASNKTSEPAGTE